MPTAAFKIKQKVIFCLIAINLAVVCSIIIRDIVSGQYLDVAVSEYGSCGLIYDKTTNIGLDGGTKVAYPTSMNGQPYRAELRLADRPYNVIYCSSGLFFNPITYYYNASDEAIKNCLDQPLSKGACTDIRKFPDTTYVGKVVNPSELLFELALFSMVPGLFLLYIWKHYVSS